MEMRTCLYCGKEFEPNTNKQRCCCKSHADKLLRMKKAQDKDGSTYTDRDSLASRNKRMIELAMDGLSCEEIKEELSLNIGSNSIYECLRKRGITAKIKRERKKPRERKPERNNEIFNLRKQGHSYKEIASLYGMTKHAVAFLCRDHGFGGVMSQRMCWDGRKRKDHAEYVNSFLGDDFTYVDGFNGCDSYVKIQCNKCGFVFEKSMITIRQKQSQHFVCPHCETLKKEEKRLKREKAAEERRERAKTRAAEKEAEREAKKRTVECKICGTKFVTYSSVKCCCSSECSKKYQNRLSSRRKDKRITEDRRIDKDITALKLYIRDGGKCWICGGRCDTNDYIIKDGVTICGDNYPSVDHVVPVCEGGEDSWDNVKLAHRICNSKRYFAEKVLACCQ